MNTHLLLHIIGFYLLVAAGETINGIIRTVYLNKRLGIRTAKRVSLLPALLLCLGICYFYVPLLGLTSDTGHLILGASLSVFMLIFDIVLGRCVMKASWPAILNEFNILNGNLLGLGVIVMALCPLLASKLPRGAW
ncbi:MAG: hypothetical protein HGA80_03910 [Candidatus Omnitrophica bacterium]|nr:hypothetical protein [Candidatus Omnitrophota bacterium]